MDSKSREPNSRSVQLGEGSTLKHMYKRKHTTRHDLARRPAWCEEETSSPKKRNLRRLIRSYRIRQVDPPKIEQNSKSAWFLQRRVLTKMGAEGHLQPCPLSNAIGNLPTTIRTNSECEDKPQKKGPHSRQKVCGAFHWGLAHESTTIKEAMTIPAAQSGRRQKNGTSFGTCQTETLRKKQKCFDSGTWWRRCSYLHSHESLPIEACGTSEAPPKVERK